MGKLVYRAGWPFVFCAKQLCLFGYLRALGYEFQKDWRFRPNPEWFDHEFDQAFFSKWRKPHFFERGVYLQEILKADDEVLDLCCGDGSVSALFISPAVKRVTAVDFDPSAIKLASSRNRNLSNAAYRVADIRKLAFPKASFDVVSWDAAIEHFTQEEMNQIFASIKNVLRENGILAGSTVAKQENAPQHHDHEFEFASAEELKLFLGRYFQKVVTWSRTHDDRTNIYFRCSDGTRPLALR